MNLARVIGTIWATRKHPELDGAKIQMVHPLSLELEPIGKPIAAIDTVGAGEGELVYYVTAYEAVIPYHRKTMVPAREVRNPAREGTRAAPGGGASG